jgi:SAM-dependent methyltransferase
MEDSPIFNAARRTLNLVYQGKLYGRSIADLGCLEGGYATEFARLGLESTGLEVRSSNIAACNYVKSNVDLPNLKFIQDDAMNIKRYGPFDVLFVCGLLYHLDRPRKFLEEAAEDCGKVMIIDTHIAPVDHEASVDFYKLSDSATNEGLRGRWYQEYETVPAGVLDAMKWSSWSNNKSFWIEKPYLMQTIASLGFDIVFEQFDCELDIVGEYTSGYRKANSRAFLVGIRSEATAAVHYG